MICLWVGSVSAEGPGEEIVVPARQHGVEVALRLEIQAMEAAQFVEEASPNDEHIFVRGAHSAARARTNTSPRSAAQ